jgi:predicted HTH transcriptional regulator
MNTPQPNGYQTGVTDHPEFVQQPAARLPWFHICTVIDKLPIASMIPDDVERELRSVVGDAYRSLDELGRVILMLAHRLGEISNEDIQHYRREHPRDIGVRLKQLVTANWLEKAEHGRGTRYCLPVRVQVDDVPNADSEYFAQESAQEKIIQLLNNEPHLTRHQLAQRLSLTPDSVKHHLQKLKAAGRIEHVGSTKAGYWRVLKEV